MDQKLYTKGNYRAIFGTKGPQGWRTIFKENGLIVGVRETRLVDTFIVEGESNIFRYQVRRRQKISKLHANKKSSRPTFYIFFYKISPD